MESIKERIKELVKDRSKKMLDLAEALGITNQGMYKALRDGTIKLSQLEVIAEFIGVHVTELLPPKPETQQVNNVLGEANKTYGTRVDRNNFFAGKETDFVKLQTENEQLKTMIQKQEDEIKFLRGLLQKS